MPAATPINITAISRSGGVVTINYASAFVVALVPHQAIWTQNVTGDSSFTGIYDIASTPTPTSLTYLQPGLANSSPSATGTIVPAKQWISLDLIQTNGGELDVNVEFWYSIPSGAEIISGSVSSLPTAKLSADEQAAFAAGRLISDHLRPTFPTGTSQATMANQISALYAAKIAFRATTSAAGAVFGFFNDGQGVGRV